MTGAAIGSATQPIGKEGLRSAVRIAASGITGGVVADLSGGEFWEGFGQAVIVTALNHLAHELVQSDPLRQHEEVALTLEEWTARYGGMTREEVLENIGVEYGVSGGPGRRTGRYMQLPDGTVVDMAHFIVAGKAGKILGTLNEIQQYVRGSDSGFNQQDMYSNELGYNFYRSRRVSTIHIGPVNVVESFKYDFSGGFANSINNFFSR